MVPMSKFVRFESTIWDFIKKARRSKTALDQVIRSYRPAIVNFVRRCGFAEEEAEDLSQEVFLRICRGNVLERIDREKGKFRTFLLVMTKNIIASEVRKRQAEKRGGGVKPLSIEEMKERTDFDLQGQERETRDEEFNRIWLQNLVRQALAKLDTESQAKKNLYFQALTLYLTGLKYEEVARRLGKTVQDVKVLIHYGRTKVKTHVKELIVNYSSSQQEYEEELRALSKYM
jgi:RNA polymerase sigma-70 factor (ECF subfamily)